MSTSVAQNQIWTLALHCACICVALSRPTAPNRRARRSRSASPPPPVARSAARAAGARAGRQAAAPTAFRHGAQATAAIWMLRLLYKQSPSKVNSSIPPQSKSSFIDLPREEGSLENFLPDCSLFFPLLALISLRSAALRSAATRWRGRRRARRGGQGAAMLASRLATAPATRTTARPRGNSTLTQ